MDTDIWFLALIRTGVERANLVSESSDSETFVNIILLLFIHQRRETDYKGVRPVHQSFTLFFNNLLTEVQLTFVSGNLIVLHFH